MKQENSWDFEQKSLSYADIERLAQRARAERDAALGRALRLACLAFASGLRHMTDVIENAYRLRTLAMMSDQQLAARGLTRSDVPAAVYNWSLSAPIQLTQIDVQNGSEIRPHRPDRIAA